MAVEVSYEQEIIRKQETRWKSAIMAMMNGDHPGACKILMDHGTQHPYSDMMTMALVGATVTSELAIMIKGEVAPHQEIVVMGDPSTELDAADRVVLTLVNLAAHREFDRAGELIRRYAGPDTDGVARLIDLLTTLLILQRSVLVSVT